jgi:hypothetical protein
MARLDPSERLRMVEANETSTRFPLTFEGLREGYERTSVEHEWQGDLERASRAAFRALVVASMKITLAAKGVFAASADETARIDIAERVAHMNLLMGNRTGALNYLKGAVDLARKAGTKFAVRGSRSNSAR